MSVSPSPRPGTCPDEAGHVASGMVVGQEVGNSILASEGISLDKVTKENRLPLCYHSWQHLCLTKCKLCQNVETLTEVTTGTLGEVLSHSSLHGGQV